MSHRRSTSGPRKIPDRLPDIPSIRFYQKLGQGHFSEVYEGLYKDKIPAAIKVIERGSSHLISTEVQLLQDLRNLPHIIQLFEVIHDENTVLVFELVKSLDIDDFFDYLTPHKLKTVLKYLIIATNEAHKKGIVHRDIKLANIMITEDFSDLKLIDWGCGTYITDSMSPKAGSRTVRSPEMLLGYRAYGTGGDCWAIGTFIFDILTDGQIPWKAKTSSEVLIHMSRIFGGDNLCDLAYKLDIEPEREFRKRMRREPTRTLESYFDSNCRDLVDDQLVDLMKKLLTIDPAKRYTTDQALNHPYFK
ncbi:CAMK family protein kinase [Trichomonas vaginalis G3]|uniref:non-specific serine/threonine protein kinase n=1 Tax=Trichomonas vaginalis (strain ATCC PRA-98 / G3) TaxID=412133 RepID=A2G1Y7_TRIV3|nr:protein serine/threonine kinase protein [Trichomonas vaginalis G3]EAX88822.1 CAMK family protein kinase [Trichomonas vaginalis G3]KAI5531582.1 protein serine/threonine kinase protein [Trichomonas vaginalis G3]|eukprot:XP_001301752.1 CAMK family protein kinase [Trichomonas vaginalis G3]